MTSKGSTSQLNTTQLSYTLKHWAATYPEAIAASVCGLLTLVGWLALNQSGLGLGIWLLLAAYVIGGYDSARDGLTTLWQERDLDVDLLMIVAAVGAAALGLWQQDYYLLVDGAVLILIFAVSGALESIAMRRTERNIRSLMQLAPDTARILLHGQEQTIATEKLAVGDRILIKPGELVPTDGLIREGSSMVNQASITGESVPVEKSYGDEVFAGTINGSGALTVELHKPPESSMIQRVIRLVEQAKTSQPPSQQFLEWFERGYARIIVGLGIALALVPPILLNWSWETTIYRALVFLVVASPCALMAAIMPTLLSGIAYGARQGILFKDGAQLEAMGRVRAIAFDKTGTLTTGELQVSHVMAAPGYHAHDVLHAAASLEAYSEHPVAQAVVRASEAEQVHLSPVTNVQAHIGQGVQGLLNSQPVAVGKDRFARSLAPQLTSQLYDHLQTQGQRLEAAGQTVLWVVWQQDVLGLLAVADQIRPQAAALLEALKRMDIAATVMLTGDNAITAEAIARQANVDTVYSELMPEDKVEVLKQLQHQHGHVAMVGDGINDAPALAQASVGIAMGAAGSDIALETADIVLMGDRLEKLEQAIHIGKKSQRIVRQNIALAVTSILCLMAANFFGELTLPAGVLGHEGSTLLVTLNGLRLLRR